MYIYIYIYRNEFVSRDKMLSVQLQLFTCQMHTYSCLQNDCRCSVWQQTVACFCNDTATEREEALGCDESGWYGKITTSRCGNPCVFLAVPLPPVQWIKFGSTWTTSAKYNSNSESPVDWSELSL